MTRPGPHAPLLHPGAGAAASSLPGETRKPVDLSLKRLLPRIWQAIRPQRGRILLGLLLLLANAGCRLLLPYLVLIAIDEHLVPGQMEGFGWICAAYLGVAFLETLGRRSQLVVLETAGQSALLELRQRVFAHLQRLPAAFFDKTPLGRLVGRVTTDIEALQEMFSSGVVTILGDLIFLAAAVAVLCGLSVELTLVTLLVVPVLFVTTVLVRQRSRIAYTAMRERLSQMNGFLHEQVSGMPIVQMFGQEPARDAQFGGINQGVRDAQLRTVRWESILSASTEWFGLITTALILGYGAGLALAISGEQVLTIGVLVAFVEYMRHFFQPINELSLKLTVMQNALVASDRIFALLDEPAEEPEVEVPVATSGEGCIEFRDVSFGYHQDQPVLRGLDFKARPGESIALVGATGAGKSTILSLLTRLYEIDAGAILVDGVDIRKLSRQALRRQVGVVQQDVFLFQGSILDNIRLGDPEISDAQAIAAADALHLGEIVKRFPGGYHEPVAEQGRNLSSGEKQLIAFARMLLLAPPVLALDEATSNVDAHTEHLLQEALHRVMQGRTSLIIAHRLSTIRDVDRILVLHQGQLVEQGSHEELLAKKGVYWRLYQLQYE